MNDTFALRRSTRSGLSVAVALSLLISAQLPAAAAVGQAARMPVARPLATPPVLPASALSLSPLSAASVAPLAGVLAAPAVAPAPRFDASAALSPATFAAPADAPKTAPTAHAASAPKNEGGPRWVDPAALPEPARKDDGPRWIDEPAVSAAPAPSRLRVALAKILPFLGTGEAFDGATRRKALEDGAAVAGKAAPARAARLGRHEHRHDIVQDVSIPTPEAVRRVAAAAKATPAWLRYAAPLAIVGLTAVFYSASIVPAAIVSGALMLSILAHESAHILGLRIWGDKTPALAGRDSINPLKHISLLGTVLVPAASLLVSMSAIGFPVLFGWAKPVPVDFNNLKNPKTDAAKVAALGPLTNLALAAVAGLAFLAFPTAGVLSTALLTLFKMNLALTAFNLLPLPFLDGGKILVSMLPKSWYAKWTHDPHLPMGYQRIYKAIYEGPANLLSRLHVHSFDHVNGLTRLASLAALGAFYAAFFTVLQVPLMFLALPCSYDYWCIREKVRSEAAVKDLMDIMSQWSAVIVQIAEDKGLESEVSAYETEHAMKNALETLIDELMAKEDFKALSDADKIERMMREYPDRAADFLKDKAMPEDSKEKILEVLRDGRNSPYYDRVRGWLKDHDIFKRWDNKHEQGKLKETMKEADKKRAAGGPGGAAFGVMLGLLALGGASAVFPGAAPQLAAFTAGLGFLGMLGSIASVGDRGEASNDPRRAPVTANPQLVEGRVEVNFFAPLTGDEYTAFLANVHSEGGYGLEANRREDGSVDSVSITYSNAAAAARKAQTLRDLPNVTRVYVSPQASEIANDWREKVGLSSVIPAGKVRVVFGSAVTAEAIESFLSAYGNASSRERLSEKTYDLTVGDVETGAEIARALAADERVIRIVVGREAHGRLTGVETPAAAPVVEQPAAIEPPAEAPAAAEPVAQPAPEPVPAPRPTLPAKLKAHKEEWSTTLVIAKFEGDKTPEEVDAIARELGALDSRYADGEADFFAADLAAAVAVSKKLAERDDVREVKAHPNATASILEEAAPYPDAQAFAHERSILVQFADGVNAEQARAYGELRRLRLVFTDYRGRDGMALYEVPAGVDFARTFRMLATEDGVNTMSVRPLRERAGLEVPARVAAPAAEPEAPAEPVALPRRDPHQAWVEYLQNVKLNDGKSSLTDKQVQLLSTFLKPVAKPKGEERAPVVSRNDQVKEILPIVTSPRGMRNSVVIIGEAGVGKTAVAEGLAEMMEDMAAGDNVGFFKMDRLQGRWLVELDINKVLTQDDPVGLLGMILDMLPRLNSRDASYGNDVIVLMDEIQKFFLDPAGVKIANTLKGPLRDGKISVIATTTRKEYKEHIEKDDAFRRRFHKVEVEETNVEQTIGILRALKAFFQKLHRAVIPDETLVAAAKLSHQFDKTNYNPDKAIKLVQDSAELSRPENLRAAVSLDLRETWNQLIVATNEARQLLIDKGIASTLALPMEMYNKVADLISKAEALYAESEAITDGPGQVTVDVAKRALAIRTGIASGQLNLGEEDAARYNTMEGEVGERVVNQDRALTAIANAVRRNKAGLSNPGQPMGKFLFVGPTGVGKTYLAKELARFLFKDPEAMVRFDMSEFQEPHSVARLIGSPPGYVGHGAGGQLTEAVRKKPYSVILLDEVEKAHPDVFNVLLQILDDGRLTDGEGRTVDFKNTVIIMTSNLGMRDVDGEKFAAEADKAATPEARAAVEAAWDKAIDDAVAFNAKQFFRPEFLNRLDEDPFSKQKWVRVNRLRAQDAAKIAQLQISEFEKVLDDRHGTALAVDPSFVKFMMVEGFSPLYGARPMKAAVEKYLVDPLAQWILKEASEGRSDVRGGRIEVSYDGKQVVFKATPRPAKATPRSTVKGASETVAASVLKLIETLAGEGEGDEPSEKLFDKLMREARASAAPVAAAPSAADDAPVARAFFVPAPAPAVPDAAFVSAAHNNPKKKDEPLRAALKTVVDEVRAAGWTDAAAVLDSPAGQVGEGWLKQIARTAKEHAGVSETPITVGHSVSAERVRVVIHSAVELTPEERDAYIKHFTGEATASYLAAQQKADNLNLTVTGMVWDHNLLDLHRRVKEIPGARMGLVAGAGARGEGGTDYWLEFSKPKPAAAPAAALAPAADAPKAATPHQNRETAKVRDLLMRVVDQDRLREQERDGHAIRIAAAEGWARLARAEDADAARAWLNERHLADDDTPSGMIKSNWPLVMTAALVLERFGDARDIPMLENVARRFTDSSHFEVPAHNALTQALAVLYVRGGLSAVRAAVERATKVKSGERAEDLKNAAHRAMGAVGLPVDEDLAKRDADGLLELHRREGRLDALVADLYDKTKWSSSDEARKMAILKAAAESETSEKAVARLRETMGQHTSYSRTGYETARAMAGVLSHAGLVAGLGDALKRWLDKNGIGYSGGNSGHWTQLLAYVELARLAGGAETLGALEELMNHDPGSINSVHEQAYFTSPDAWARSLVRSGKFAEYARPTLSPDGAPGLSKLEAMLASKDKPMKVAAALRAIAYSRDPSFKLKAWEPAGALPDITPEGSGSSGHWMGGYPSDAPRHRGGPGLAEWKNEMMEHRFGFGMGWHSRRPPL